MVNRIDGNNYYDYQKLKNVNIPDASEKFSLDYKQNELQSEAKEKKDKSEKAADEPKLSSDKSGVKLELSSRGQSAAAGSSYKGLSKPETKSESQSLVETIRTFVSTAIEAVKDFFYKLWYDEPKPGDAGSIETMDSEALEPDALKSEATETLETSEATGYAEADGPTELAQTAEMEERYGLNLQEIDAGTAYRMDVERRHREIQPYLKKGDLNQVINLLTDDGRKTIARNSSLLTYYDKNGRMVEPNASDRERILHGDGNVRKL
ncbi:MAG: hypothetical protein K2K46_14310 [Lachnospiraceae bacterium]|nr:hypothetical protein [Lachnospiraceae bacterium]